MTRGKEEQHLLLEGGEEISQSQQVDGGSEKKDNSLSDRRTQERVTAEGVGEKTDCRASLRGKKRKRTRLTCDSSGTLQEKDWHEG